jgi:hypothetical protein
MSNVKHTKNELYFHEPTIKNAYMAGFIAADGNLFVRKDQNDLKLLQAALVARDSDILDHLRSELEFTGIIYEYTAKPYVYKANNKANVLEGYIVRTNPMRMLRVGHADMYHEDLATLYNITPNKSLTLAAPNITDDNLALSYILGYYYGDGSLSCTIQKERYEYWMIQIQVSELFGRWLQEKLHYYFGGTWYLRQKNKSLGWEIGNASKVTVQNFLDTMRVLPIPEEWKPLRKLYKDEYWKYRLAKEDAKKARDAKLQNT